MNNIKYRIIGDRDMVILLYYRPNVIIALISSFYQHLQTLNVTKSLLYIHVLSNIIYRDNILQTTTRLQHAVKESQLVLMGIPDEGTMLTDSCLGLGRLCSNYCLLFYSFIPTN